MNKENTIKLENVSNKFFKLYKNKYKDLKKFLVNNTSFINESKRLEVELDKFASDFSKKLMGQLAFLYFLQKKGWLNVKNNSYNSKECNKNFIRILFEKSIKNENNFFNDYLEYLFYNTLNNNMDNIQYYKRFNVNIPFLNDDLFKPIYKYDWKSSNIKIPNDMFSNEDNTGILDIFDLFNFTLNEDESLEREIDIDPEMLGKVFESLLNIDDRKSSGTYYTPREIVDYMCEEEVISYLLTNTNLDYNILEKIIRHKEFNYIENLSLEDIKNIDKLLEIITIVDPSVGSGAFLIGMLNLIVKIRNQLRDSSKAKDILPKATRYDLKLQALKNSIYGVDIEKEAIEITKLRLWLSLIVDATEVTPLPNLDFNIQVGNSLIDEYLDCNIFKIENTLSTDIHNIYNYKNKYFNTHNQIEKNNIKKTILDLQFNLALNQNPSLKTLSPSQLKDNKEFFNWQLAFSHIFLEKNGFDIVIGNPPYVGEKKNKDKFITIKKTDFGKQFYQGKMDLFYFFFHKSLDIINEYGNIAFITTNYFFTADGAIKLREDLYKRSNIYKLINFNELKVFDSAKGQHNAITFLSKKNKITSNCDIIYSNVKEKISFDILNNILNKKDCNTVYYTEIQENLYDGDKKYIRIKNLENITEFNDAENILNKISFNNEMLGKICDINQGIVTGADSVSKSHCDKFGYDKNLIGRDIFILNDIVNYCNIEERILKSWFKNSDINKYYSIDTTNKKVLYIQRNEDEDDIKNSLKHLYQYKYMLERRSDVMQGNYPWYSLHRPRNKEIFESEKIVVPQRSKKNTFAYNNCEWYAAADVYFITNPENEYDLKYLLGILNSKLYYFWLYFRGKRKGNNLELLATPLKEIPIKKTSKKYQDLIIEKINIILDISKQNISNIEKDKKISLISEELDNIIYNIYNLTDNEIAIVENLYSKNLSK